MRALHAGPTAQGLYDPRFEHDACGVAFVATLTGPGRPLTPASAVRAVLRWPVLTLRTSALIRWQGIRLWLRRVPVQPRPADATADERGR